jgi:hypothetical protein
MLKVSVIGTDKIASYYGDGKREKSDVILAVVEFELVHLYSAH